MITKTLQINYDLRAPGRNYERLYTYIKSFNGWAHPLESMWLVKTSKSAKEVRAELGFYVDSNDHVVVFDVTGVAWSTSFSDEETKWMKGYMPLAA